MFKIRSKHNALLLATLAGVAAYSAATIVRHRWRYSFRNRVVVITGGSRGLGLELARRWGAEGARLFLCARHRDELEAALRELEVKGYSATGAVCDVRSQDQVCQFVAHVINKAGRIDVLVNNAGIIQAGPQANMTNADYRDAMDTHFWGPLHFIEAVLPSMRSDGEGRIVNIASIGGEVSVPHLLPYCASKFALVGLSQGMATELAADGIRVTTICPGLMRTGSPRNALFKGQHRKEYAWFSIGASLPGITIGSQRAARQIVEACRIGRPYLAISLPTKVAIKLQALAPTLTAHVMRAVNGFLPAATSSGFRSRRGKDSFSEWFPSVITQLTEHAARRNNELI